MRKGESCQVDDTRGPEEDRPVISRFEEEALAAGENGFRGMSSWSRRVVIPCSVTALAVSAYLAWSALIHGSVAGCSANGVWDCSHVLSSRWSKCLGIPVSIPAMAIHITLLSSLTLAYFGVSNGVKRIADRMLFFCACCAALAALWFIGLQVFVVGKLCKWCMVAHATGILACLAITVDYALQRCGGIPLRPIFGALTVTMALALVQVFGPVPETAIITVYDSSEPASNDVLDMDFELIDSPVESQKVGMDQGAPQSSDAAVLATATTQSQVEASNDHDVQLELDEANAMPVVATSTPEPAKDSVSAPKVQPPCDDAASAVIPIDDAQLNLEKLPEDSSAVIEQAPIPTPTPLPDEPASQDSKPVSETAPTVAPRAITFPGARTQLKVNQWPLIGSPDARVVLAELFDYSCAHCRQMNRDLVVARNQFGCDLAIIALPVPLQSDCNPTVQQTSAEHRDSCELSNLALAVWRINPAAFADFHDWLCAVEPGRTAAAARLEAERRVDPAALRAELMGNVPGQYIARHVAIYQRAGEGTLPKLLSDVITVTGQMNSAQSLCDTLQAKHGLAPVIR